jgi:hypothetical protein
MTKKILIFFSIFFVLCSFKLHPYHVGSVEFKYSLKSKTFQISGKFFLDDLENALKEKYGKTVHFNDEKYKIQIDDLLKNIAANT